MPHPKGARGGKKRKGKKSVSNNQGLEYAGSDQYYGLVIKVNQGKQVQLQSSTGETLCGKIRNSIRSILTPGSVVIYTRRIFNSDSEQKIVANKVDIIHHYNMNDARRLVKEGKINFKLKEEDNHDAKHNTVIVFEDDDWVEEAPAKESSSEEDESSSEVDFDEL